MSEIALIAAVGANRAIGRDNKLLWNLPGDLKRFRQLTIGKNVIMGRKTYESIGKALPHRTNIVLTNNPDWSAEDCIYGCTFESAVKLCKEQLGSHPIMVIGGGQVYAEALPQATTLYLTEVEDAPEADAFFPDWKREQFQLIDEQPGTSLPGMPEFTYRTYKRR